MTVPRPIRAASALAALLLLAGCAERIATMPRTAPLTTPAVTLPAEPGALVLRVEHVGGFVPVEWRFGRIPGWSLYADGRLITDGPVPAIHPGPALPDVQVQRLDRETVRELAARALAAGVGETADLGVPPIADAPSTRFTLTTAEGTVVREVYALSEHRGGGTDAGLTGEQVAGRARLQELLAALSEVGRAPSPEGGAPVEPYVPEAVAAVGTPWADPADGLVHAEQPWPGPELPGEPVGGPLEVGCVVATGDAADAVLAAGATATAATTWVSGGSRGRVLLRPLLPDESGCADLGD